MAKQKNKQVARYCAICGKVFLVPTPSNRSITCSPECKKIYTRQYNSQYRYMLYHENEEARAKILAVNAKASKKSKIRLRWKRRLEHADNILRFVGDERSRELIAMYIDQEVLWERKDRGEKTDDEKKAKRYYNKWQKEHNSIDKSQEM